MPALEVLKIFPKKLKEFPVFSSFPFSLLLIGLEELIDISLSCPCKYELNIFLTTSIFIGPPLFAFALMFIVLRPFKLKCSLCSVNEQQNPTDLNGGGSDQQNPTGLNGGGSDQQNPTGLNGGGSDQQNPTGLNGGGSDQQNPTGLNGGGNNKKNSTNPSNGKANQNNFWKALGHCLIPPVMLIIYMFLDGDYVACGLTRWEGNYVFEFKRAWCKPFKSANAGNQSDLWHEYQGYVSISKTLGYAVLGVFSVFIIFFMGIYDCFTSGKSDCLKNVNSACCWCKV